MIAPRGIRWDVTTDVVVIGYGGAGAVAALTIIDDIVAVLTVSRVKETIKA